MELEPEDHSIATENLEYSPSLHGIEVVYCLHGRPKSLAIPTSDIGYLRDCQGPKESLDTFYIKVDI